MYELMPKHYSEPATVIDIGVAHGTPELYARFPNSYLLLIDPMVESVPFMQQITRDRKGHHLCIALGSRSGQLELQIESVENDKVVLARTSPLERTPLTSRINAKYKTRVVQMKTLDEVVEEGAYSPPFLVKIDTEGFELEVLSGGTNTLKSASGIIVECSIARRFVGGYEFADLIAFMDDSEFRLERILSHNPRFADLFFVPRHGAVSQSLK
jgi:FkbM family methyltransferase